MLKADLHIHTKGDPQDIMLNYSPQDIIKHAAKQKFDVLAITWHNKICDPAPLKSYAKEYGITLVPGIEATIEGKHTLLYNISNEEMAKVKSFEDLYAFKDHVVIGAPHPFFLLPVCLGKKIMEHKQLFDFIEQSHFYTKSINLNKKAVAVAEELKLPVIANSDVHHLPLFGKEWTLLETEAKTEAVLEVLKKKTTGRNKKLTQPYSRPYTALGFMKNGLFFAPAGIYRLMTGDLSFQKE